jgi:hypothetical protein
VRGCVRGCAWLPCAMYSRDTGNERARQYAHKRHRLEGVPPTVLVDGQKV